MVLGGTGAIGSHLVNTLAVEGGVNCFVISRKIRQNERRVNYVQGSAHDPDFVRHLLHDTKYDAIVDFMSYSTEEFKSRYWLYLDSTEQYIYLSSSRVYAESKGEIIEDSPRLLDVCKDEDYLATDEYTLKKTHQEDVLRESGYLNWTIIRPYITYSEEWLLLSPLEKECWLIVQFMGERFILQGFG